MTNFKDNEFHGPVQGSGVQITNNYLGSAPSDQQMSIPELREARTRLLFATMWVSLLRYAWVVGPLMWFLGAAGLGWSIRLSGPVDALFSGSSAWFAPMAIVGAAWDASFFVLRHRWEQRGRFWLSTEQPTLLVDVLPRLLGAVCCVFAVVMGPPIWLPMS